MKSQFDTVAKIIDALRDSDLVDNVVHQMAGGNKVLLADLKQVADIYFVAEARGVDEEKLNAFAQDLFDVANGRKLVVA